MDLFADDSDDDVEDDINDTLTLCNIAFLELMICKPFVKSTATEDPIIFHRKIVLIGEESVTSLLKEKLDRTQFKNVKISCPSSIGQYEGEEFDIVVDLNLNFQLPDENVPVNIPENTLEKLLLSGGTYMTLCPSSKFDLLFPKAKWNTAKATRKSFDSTDTDQCLEFVVVQGRGFVINTLGAIYWTGDSNADNGAVKIGQKKDKISAMNATKSSESKNNARSKLLDTEYSNLEEVTVALSSEERQTGVFSDISHSKALSALQNHGLCILPGIFSIEMVMEWGDAAVSDMKEALFTLRKRGIDLSHPGEGGPRIENFHELSMREALRCDLRNGRHLKALSQRNSMNSTVGTLLVGDSDSLKNNENNNNNKDNNEVSEKKNENNDNKEMKITGVTCPLPSATTTNSSKNKDNIRLHPALLSVLHQTLNPRPSDPRDQLGNWGLWNFEGRGPEFGPPDFAIGEVGAVMSLPGCVDQTIHADTPHLYVHTQLPGHYINLFVPAVAVGSSSGGIEVGQTAFVVGSHQLRTSAHIMNEEGGQEMLENRLVRPHLHAGDALLFDCRILHFGLANQYPRVESQKQEDENKIEITDQNSDENRNGNINNNSNNSTSSTEGEKGERKGEIVGEREGEREEKRGGERAHRDCSDGWRPLLYVNYHQKFFQDPKNWNDKEKLFT